MSACSFCLRGNVPLVQSAVDPSHSICERCAERSFRLFRPDAPADARRPLTRRQREILNYLMEFQAANKFMPSFDEIALRFKYASLATVHEHLCALERKGWIARERDTARAITLLGAA